MALTPARPIKSIHVRLFRFIIDIVVGYYSRMTKVR